MIKWVRVALIVPIVFFFGWYIPVAWNNVLACDDYWHCLNVVRYGFIGAQFHYWLHWEGSFVHTLFATLPHLVWCRYTPFIFNMLTITAAAMAFSVFVKSFTWCGKGDSALIGTYLTVLLYTFAAGASEIRFWLCASVPYVLGIVGLTLLITLRKSRVFSWRELLLLLISLILTAGNKISFIAAAVILIVVCDLCDRRFNKHTHLVLFALAVLSLINVVAPGNFSRLNENVANAETVFGVADVFLDRMRTIGFYSSSIVFLLPVIFLTREDFHGPRLMDFIKITGVLLAFFVADSLLMYICFRDPGPTRTYIILEWLALIGSLLLIASLRPEIEKCHTFRMVAIAVALCAVIGLSWHELKILKDVPATLMYSRCSRLRDAKVQDAKCGTSVELPLLPSSYLLLSYFSNDLVWINNVYLPSFGKNLSCKGISEVPSGF